MARISFTLTSSSVIGELRLARRHTCEGDDLSPELEWSHPPPGTRSYAVVMVDLDSRAGSGPGKKQRSDFTHWLLFDIPADLEELPAGVSGVGVPGKNDFHGVGYRGPCPPANDGDHRYRLQLHALAVPSLGLPAGATREEVELAMSDSVLDVTELVFRYSRR